jgi:hypothetical protein
VVAPFFYGDLYEYVEGGTGFVVSFLDVIVYEGVLILTLLNGMR